MKVWAMPVAQDVTATMTGPVDAPLAAGAGAGAAAGSSSSGSSAFSTIATISSGVFAARSESLNSGTMSERASLESIWRCSSWAPSGAAMKKTRSLGPS